LTGKVDFALTLDDLSETLAGDPRIKTLKNRVFAVSVKVSDEESLALAEDILFAALEKLPEGQL
jgi:hypothetical protein